MADKNLVAKQMNSALKKFIQSSEMDDSEKMQYADLYPTWQSKVDAKTSLSVGEIVSYGVNTDSETQLYEVLQAHTPQSDWTPDTAVSLFKKIGFTDVGISIWTQPYGDTDAYMIGDVVSHNDTTYTSAIDYNIWEPGVYGWEIKS